MRKKVMLARATPINGQTAASGSLAGAVAQLLDRKPSVAVYHLHRGPLDLLLSWHVSIETSILEKTDIDQPQEDVAAGSHAINRAFG